MWMHLRHPYVLPFLGIDQRTFKYSFCLVSPWLPNGNVMKYMEEWGEADNIPYLKWVKQGAEGVRYLHGEDIVHGDLKGVSVTISTTIGSDLWGWSAGELPC